MIDNDLINRNWQGIKGGVKAIWGKITDEELEMYKNDFLSIGSIIKSKYFEKPEDIRTKLETLTHSFDNESDRGEIGNESSFLRRPEDSNEWY